MPFADEAVLARQAGLLEQELRRRGHVVTGRTADSPLVVDGMEILFSLRPAPDLCWIWCRILDSMRPERRLPLGLFDREDTVLDPSDADIAETMLRHCAAILAKRASLGEDGKSPGTTPTPAQ